eukprot:15364940-Ditylum_brightwellii.AAC.1
MQDVTMIFLSRDLLIQSQFRTDNMFGVPIPRSKTSSRSVNDITFCDKSEVLMYNAMKDGTLLGERNKEDVLYLVPSTNAVFLHNRPSPIHTVYHAYTDKYFVLSCHCDAQNPTRDPTLADSLINCPVGCASICKIEDSNPKRVSLTANGRKSIVKAFQKTDKYNSYLGTVCQFHNSLDKSRITISCDLVKDLTIKVNNEGAFIVFLYMQISLCSTPSSLQ